MKKIMFNDKYGLTAAVLQGRKTMTRRILTGVLPIIQELRISDNVCEYKDPYTMKWYKCNSIHQPQYKVGEVVAIAQSYKDVYNEIKNPCELFSDRLFNSLLKEHKGWSNKMFVKADLMPHRIRITDIRVERLRDISDEDVYKEGIYDTLMDRFYHYRFPDSPRNYMIPREAFAALIVKVRRRGTWERNPWVFAYSFELVK